ncbi:MAG: pilus assembly protein PilM [Lentisphaerae bacterium]|nr:pilus assembly protein PilM [Lentisphaerota bacterium]
MQWKNTTSCVGLDIGQSEVKTILLERKGKNLLIARKEVLSIWEEGILDDKELYRSIGTWLQEKKLNEISCCAGLPQFLTTPQISDFPPGIDDDTLKTLVRNETAQLSGLSDESFIHDYQPLKPFFGRKNPVLIGICRESAVNEQVRKLRDIEVNVQDMGMNGLAVVNAFYFLHPREKENPAIQLLLDLGNENSTLAIVAQGQVLYISSLMFGSRRFSKLLAQELNCSENEAEMRKSTYKPDWSNPDSPFLTAVRQLENELKIATEHWQQSELPEFQNQPISKIWMTGGGARFWGLNAQLIRTYACPVEILGVKNNEQTDPTLIVALGLALQGIGQAECSISLIPNLLRWQQQKIARLPYLRGTAVILIAALLVFLFWFHYHVTREQSRLEARMSELNLCNSLVPRLDAAQAQIGFYQKMLIPLVESGSRSQQFLDTLKELQLAMATTPDQDEGWCIYVADEFSYQNSTKVIPEKAPAATTTEKKPVNVFRASEKTPEPAPAAENTILVHKIPQLEKMIVGGYSVVPPDKGKYEATKEILDKLNAGTLFAGADWFSDWDETHSLQIFQPWQQFAQASKGNKKNQVNYHDFRIQLPFKTLNVKKPPPPPPPKRKRR